MLLLLHPMLKSSGDPEMRCAFHMPLSRAFLASKHARDPSSSNPSQSVRVGITFFMQRVRITFFSLFFCVLFFMLTSCVEKQSHVQWFRFLPSCFSRVRAECVAACYNQSCFSRYYLSHHLFQGSVCCLAKADFLPTPYWSEQNQFQQTKLSKRTESFM